MRLQMKAADKLAALQRRLGYQFKTLNLLEQALTHKSASFKHNERFEFLGDAILNFVIADLLYQQFDEATEGELTRARASLVKKQTLSDIALEFNLSEYLRLGIGEQRSGGFRRESILADTLEAIICAIYLDGGFAACRECLAMWFGKRVAQAPNAQGKDPKTRLQEWLQANGRELPKYQVAAISGEAHSQNFAVTCEIACLGISAQGLGSSRKIAEQVAARKILELIIENEIN